MKSARGKKSKASEASKNEVAADEKSPGPHDESDARSCTPDQRGKPQREEKNLRSFRIEHEPAPANSSIKGIDALDNLEGSPEIRQPSQLASRRLPSTGAVNSLQHKERCQTKLKVALQDAIDCVGLLGNPDIAGEFLCLLEQGVKDMRIARSEIKRLPQTARASNANATDSPSKPLRISPSLNAKQSSFSPFHAQSSSPVGAATTVLPLGAAIDPDVSLHSPPAAELAVATTSPNSAHLTGSNVRDRLVAAKPSDDITHASADSRLKEAEARRSQMLSERQQRHDLQEERLRIARARRDQKIEETRQKTLERQERATHNRDDVVAKVVEGATCRSQRVDEVAFINKMKESNKAALLREKEETLQNSADRKREEQQQAAKDRESSYQTVIGKKQALETQKLEKAQQRAKEKEERVARIEEARRSEQEQRQKLHEEKERKIHENQQVLQNYEDERLKKSTQRLEHSSAFRQQLLEQTKVKADLHDQKAKAVRERKGTSRSEGNTSFHDVMPTKANDVEAKREKAMLKAREALLRTSKQYIDQVRKDEETSCGIKELNKSRIRAPMTRISHAVAGSVLHARQPLHELRSDRTPLSDIDGAFLRYSNAFGVLCTVVMEAKKLKDAALLQNASSVVLKFLSDPVEGNKNIDFFFRSGHLLTFVDVVREEINNQKRHHDFGVLGHVFTSIQRCLTFLLRLKGGGPQREHFLTYVESSDLTDFAVAVLSTNMANKPENLECVISCLIIVEVQLASTLRRNCGSEQQLQEWNTRLTEALVTLVTGIVIPDGVPTTTVLAPGATLAIFLSLRILNEICRLRLRLVQAVVETHLSLETFHMFTALLGHINEFPDNLEDLQPSQVAADLPLSSASFAEAATKGLTTEVPLQSINPDGSYLRAALHELVLFMGYLPLENTQMQELFCWGKTRVIQLLCALPLTYFNKYAHVLFPTLIAISHTHAVNRSLLSEEVSLASLGAFIAKERDNYEASTSRNPNGTPKKLSDQSTKPQTTPRSGKGSSDVLQELLAAPPAVNEQKAPQARRGSTSSITSQLTQQQEQQLLQNCMYFRFDKRFPPQLWHDAERFLED